MSSNKDKDSRVVILPDYIESADLKAQHAWRQWESISYEILNFPGRIQTVVNQKTGATKDLDLQTPMGVLLKIMKSFDVDPIDIERVMSVAKKMQQLRADKGRLKMKWSNMIFGKKGGNKDLLEIRGQELMDMFGKFYTLEEVGKIIRHEWNLAVTNDQLKEFYNKRLDKIEAKKADYVLRGKETRLATDAGRMEILSKLAWEFENKFNKTKSIEVSKELRSIIEQIRKEVKGEEIRLTVDGRIDIQATIQANQVIHEALQKLPINMIVIGMVAAKKGINPANIIASLTNSYYSKFNGYNSLAEKEELKLPGEYIKTYDWSSIRSLNASQIQDVEPITVTEIIEEDKKAEVEIKKKDLLTLLEEANKRAEGEKI